MWPTSQRTGEGSRTVRQSNGERGGLTCISDSGVNFVMVL